MKSVSRSLSSSLLLCVLVLSLVPGCKQKKGGPPPGMKMPVLVAQVEQETIFDQVRSVGDIAGDENVELRSEIDGRIKSIDFREGQVVEKGVPLVQVDQQKLKASLAEAGANFNLAKANRSRNLELLKSKTISQKEFDQAEAEYLASKATVERLRRNLGDSKLKAPFSGVMGRRRVSPGQWVQKGQVVSSIVSLGHAKVEFAVPERYLAKLKAGQQVVVKVAAYPQEEFRGELFFISSEIDLATRTVLVKARIPNVDLRLRAGMLAEVSTIIEKKENAMTIPESAVLLQKGDARVFVPNAEGIVEMRSIKLGKQLPGKVEVLDGLKIGELVVTEGVQKIGPGAPIAFEDPRVAKESTEVEQSSAELEKPAKS